METENKLPKTRGRKKRPPLRESDVAGFKYFRKLGELLRSLHAHADVPNRKLHYD